MNIKIINQNIRKAFFISVLALLILVPICFELAYWQKIYPGISVVQTSIGNHTRQSAQKTAQRIIGEKRPKNIQLLWNNQSWEINLEELNLVYQLPKTINRAYSLGRNQNLIANLKIRYQIWRNQKDLNFDYTLNYLQLEKQITVLADLVFVPNVSPSISLDPKTQKVTIDPGREGQKLEKEKLLHQINLQIGNLNDTPISLPVKKTNFLVDSQTLEKTKNRAQILLDKKLTLQNNEQIFTLSGEEIFPFLSFQANTDFDEEKIKNYVHQLANSIDQDPQDALFRFENNKVSAFLPSKNGISLDQDKTIQSVKESLKELEKTEEKEKDIQLSIQAIEPEIKIADINRFGIKEKIGEGESNFRGSIVNRIHNLQLASAKLSSTLVPPGKIFSFNQSLGDVSLETGFKQAYIIKKGRTILGDGGGVCQVSTTLFRAALDAGLPIIERHAHAYRVAYYEQDFQPGFDATVFDPSADLKFRNDTPDYILIQPQLDTQAKTLKFEIYGTSDHREIIISKARIWDQTSPPPDLYQDDPTLPIGTVEQIDWQAWGAKVAFDWKVTRNEEILQDRTFYSVYHPWQAVYLRGTRQ